MMHFRRGRDARCLSRCTRVLFGLFALASALPATASTLDPSGDLDTSFGPSGLPQFNVATVTVPSFSRAVVALPGGAVIVGGGSNSNGLYKDYVIQKLDANGNFDGSFGTDAGFTHTDMGADDQINAMAVNSTGTRICGGGIAGPTATTSAAFGVACYTANGLLDPTFSGDGIDKSNPTGVTVSRIEGMTFDRDDKLIVVGWSNNPAPRDWMIRRYNTDGTPDTTFGPTGDGWIVLDWGGFDRCFDVAMLYGATHAQDRIVVVGSSQNNAGAIAIFTSTGALDTASNGLTGVTGKFTGTPGSLTQFRGVAIEQSTATKYIVVTGQGATSPGFIVARYALATGAVNVTGNLGSSGNDVGWRVKVGANDLVYASGTVNASPADFRVLKLTSALATTWAATTDFGGSDFAQDLVIANSGDPVNERVTAVGGGSGGLNSMTVARYKPDGTLDTAFSGDGKYEAQLTGGSSDESVAFAVQADGNAVVAGTTFNSAGDYDLAVTRIKTDGTRDTAGWASASGGWYIHGFTAGSAEQLYPGGVAIDSNGKAVVVGTSNGYFAERFTTAGAPDVSFNATGIVLNNWGTNSEGKVVAIDASNNVIVGGDISLNGDFKFSRLAASNGAVDATFGSSGTATVDISAGKSDVLKAIAIDPSGRIVAGGACVNSSSFFKMCLARLNANGTLDTSFNTTGKVFLSNLSGNDTFDIRSLQLLPNLDTPSATDYKIVVAGQYVQSSPSQAMWLAARFNMDGSLDTSFNTTGYKTFPAGTAAYVGSANSVALQYDEKLIIVGESSAPDPLNAGFFLNRVITVARLNWDGSLDTTYGTNGFTYTSFSSDPSEAHQAYVYPQSNATLKGRALLSPFIIASDFAMNRYLADPAPIAGAGDPDLVAASDTGRSNTDNVTNDTTPTFTGTCSQGETVYLLVNGANTQPRTRQLCGAAGTYSLTPTLSGVPRTTYSITTQTQSGIGDSAVSGALSVTVDAEINPAVVINNPTAGSNQLPNVSVDGTSEAVAAITVTTNHPKGGGCTVAFLADGNATGSGTGNWTCSNTAFKQGPHTISVVQTDLAGNVASAVTRSFSVKVPTTTAIVSSVNPTKFGQPVTFTATVTPGANADLSLTGTNIRFVEGAATLATVALDASGQATYTPSGLGLAVGFHTIQAVYDENANWLASSAQVIQEVQKADTATVVASAVNPSVFGQSVTFTATVSSVAPGAGTPTGTVTFLDGVSSIGSGVLAGGVATFSTSALSVGSHSITASYGGSGSYNISTGTLTGDPQVVNKANTATAVVSSLNPSVLSQSVTFTATVTAVSPGAGTPSGTVTFLDGGSSIGTGTLSGGVATLSTSALTVGNHTITTTYTGDGNFNGSSGSLASNPQVVNKKPTTTSVSSAPKPSVFGQSVTFTATVTATSPYTGTPTGTVTFLDAGSSIGTGILDGSGVATFTTSSLLVGSHAITANYGADTNFDVSTGTLSGGQGVSKANTSTAVASSANPAVFGQTITFTATVSATAPGAGTPSGTVTFLDGASSIGSGILSGGIATFSTSVLAVGNSHTISASYAGDSSFNSSSGPLPGNPQVVNKANSATLLTSSQNPSVFGESITLTATVSAVAPGSGAPNGTVIFNDGANQIASVALTGGIATFTTTALVVGDHTITTSYSGDSGFNGSLGSLADNPQVVNKADATTALASSQNPSTIGQTVTFTATLTAVVPSTGTPTGSVDFLDGGNSLGSGPLDASGVATFTTSALPLGPHSITTNYVGDSGFNGSTATLTGDPQVVTKNGSTTALISSANPSVFGQSVTFTATVAAAPPGSGTPTGTVTFLDGGTPIGAVALSAGVATLTTSSMAVGNHTITADYSGDSNFDPSNAALAGSPQVVLKADTTTSVTSSQNPTLFGQSVTFTATVVSTAPGAGTATGTVTFLDGGSSIGSGILSGGVATLTLSSLAVGDHTITTSYAGDANFNVSAGSLTGNPQKVNKATATTAVTSSQNSSVFGQSVTFTATLTVVAPGAGTLSGSVTFLDGGLSIGTGALSGGVATFTTSTLAVGNHTITTDYPGDGSFNGSTGTLTGNPQVVNKSATTALIQLTPAGPITVGSPVSMTATVAAVAPGAGMPTGTITFLDGASTLGSVALSGGTAVFSTSALTVGSHPITSSYGGDGSFQSSTSASAILSVTPTTHTLSASAGANGSITPSTQYIVDGNTASFTVTPANGYTAVMGTDCPEGIGTLANNVYTTLAISTDCAVTATFTPVSANLTLTLTDNRGFAHYGGFINYIVTLSNSSGADATGLSISGVETSPSSDLDTANGHWQCFGTPAQCLPSGTGAFIDGNVTVPANSSLTWIVSIPKRPSPPDGLASYAVSVSGTTPALMQFDTDIFVIFRDSFDVPNGDGTQSPQPGIAAPDWGGSALTLTLPPGTRGVIQTVFDAKSADQSGFRVEQYSADAQNWLRVVTASTRGETQSSAWIRVAPLASLSLGITGAPGKNELVLLGGESELDVPLATSTSWTVRMPPQGE